MTQRPNNFNSVVHNEDFMKPFEGKKLTYKDMLNDAGRAVESLNGRWHFAVDQYDMSLRSNWFLEKEKDDNGRYLPLDYDFDQWETVSVPSCWNLQKEKYFYYESNGIYTRTFRYFPVRKNERVFLRFGAAAYAALVFFNTTFVGSHEGASTPFYVEVTDLLKENNRLAVVVENRRKPTRVPMHNTDWFNYGGLYRDVELIRVPQSFIRDYFVRLRPDGCFNTIDVDVTVEGLDRDGTLSVDIPELNISQKLSIKKGQGSAAITAEPELWSPDNPRLYEVRLSYKEDQVTEQIGFREIKVNGTDIYLNGKKIFLRGISCHEESIKNGKSISEDEIIENFILAKEMNCNYLRLVHYPHTEKTARIADKMGMMLWEEIPVYWSIAFEHTPTYRDAENQLLEMIKRDRNRASVIIWSVGNENADTDSRLTFMKSLASKARQTDPTRLITAANVINHVDNKIEDRLAEFLDVIGINQYYGWYDPDYSKLPKLFENSKPDKPVIISEFGGGARAGQRGTINDCFTEDNQLHIYRMQISVMERIPYIKGISPWILYDFRSPRRTNPYQDYYNRKGLLSEDKKHKKLAFDVMKEFYYKIAQNDT